MDEHAAPRCAILKPRMLGAIPLYEFTHGRTTRPSLAMPGPYPLRLPQPFIDHPVAQCVGAQRTDRIVPRQMLSQECRAKGSQHRCLRSLYGSLSKNARLHTIRTSTAQSMNHRSVSLHLPAAAQSSELPGRKTHQLRPSPRCDQSVTHLLRDRKSISISLVQCQHLLPRIGLRLFSMANKIRKRTFLLQPNRTFLFQCYSGNSRLVALINFDL